MFLKEYFYKKISRQQKKQEQEVSKAHIPPAVAIRGCNTFREKTKLLKISIVKDFIILNQVDSEKTLMKNVPMCYIGVTEGKIENLKKEGKMRISILIFICLPEGVHKIS